MEIKKIKIAGREVTAIYNCGSYIFYSNYYGVIGIASRTAITENHEPTYLLAAGTENTVGGQREPQQHSYRDEKIYHQV